ncbi:MAG: hypothetical protein PHI90_05925 [Clostridia bacterium]|nr:hypothetical protein [Clostridia bacterium]MDD4048350.1 hypothetical protein [Clostridia bacterium]
MTMLGKILLFLLSVAIVATLFYFEMISISWLVAGVIGFLLVVVLKV